MSKKIILCGGKAQSGKNQAADFMMARAKKQGFTSKQLYFAKPVKDLAKKAYNEYSIHLNASIEEIISRLGELGVPTEDKAVTVLRKLVINPENWYENKTTSTRLLIQSLGTDIVRNSIDENHWVDLATEQIMESKEEIIFVTDFRFPNEYYGLHESLTKAGLADFELIAVKIERGSLDTSDKMYQHKSETALDDFGSWSFIIENNKTLKGLENSCTTLFDEIIYSEYEAPTGL
jgi:hypothetical protein